MSNLQQNIDFFIKSLETAGKANGTIRVTKKTLSLLAVFIGKETELINITAEKINEFKKSKMLLYKKNGSKKADASVFQAISILKNFFIFCQQTNELVFSIEEIFKRNKKAKIQKQTIRKALAEEKINIKLETQQNALISERYSDYNLNKITKNKKFSIVKKEQSNSNDKTIAIFTFNVPKKQTILLKKDQNEKMYLSECKCRYK